MYIKRLHGYIIKYIIVTLEVHEASDGVFTIATQMPVDVHHKWPSCCEMHVSHACHMHEPGTDARIWTCDVWWAAHIVTLSGASVYPTLLIFVVWTAVSMLAG